MSNPTLSVVIPTYNEKDNIPKILEKLKKVLKSITHEIIFVDDNSPDGTSAVIKDCIKNSSKIRLIHRIGRKGLSGAVIEGLCSERWLGCGDGLRLTAWWVQAIDMINLFSKNNSLDIVIGSRFTETGEILKKLFQMRKLGSKFTTYN